MVMLKPLVSTLAPPSRTFATFSPLQVGGAVQTGLVAAVEVKRAGGCSRFHDVASHREGSTIELGTPRRRWRCWRAQGRKHLAIPGSHGKKACSTDCHRSGAVRGKADPEAVFERRLSTDPAVMPRFRSRRCRSPSHCWRS